MRAFDYHQEFGHGTRRRCRRFFAVVAETPYDLPETLMWNTLADDSPPLTRAAVTIGGTVLFSNGEPHDEAAPIAAAWSKGVGRLKPQIIDWSSPATSANSSVSAS